jgi:hypothetical protein
MRTFIVSILLLNVGAAMAQGYAVQGPAIYHFETPEQHWRCVDAWNRPDRQPYRDYCLAWVKLCKYQGHYHTRFTPDHEPASSNLHLLYQCY